MKHQSSGYPMKVRILSISYDLAVLQTREMMLCQAGYKVVSAEGFTAGPRALFLHV